MFLCLLSGRDTCCLSRWDKATVGRTARRCRAGRDLTTHTAASPLSGETKGRCPGWTWLTMKTTTAAQKWWVALFPAVVSWTPLGYLAFASCVDVWFVDRLEGGGGGRQQTRHWKEREKQTVVKRGQKINSKHAGCAIKWPLADCQLDFAVPAGERFGLWTEERTTRERR